MKIFVIKRGTNHKPGAKLSDVSFYEFLAVGSFFFKGVLYRQYEIFFRANNCKICFKSGANLCAKKLKIYFPVAEKFEKKKLKVTLFGFRSFFVEEGSRSYFRRTRYAYKSQNSWWIRVYTCTIRIQLSRSCCYLGGFVSRLTGRGEFLLKNMLNSCRNRG